MQVKRSSTAMIHTVVTIIINGQGAELPEVVGLRRLGNGVVNSTALADMASTVDCPREWPIFNDTYIAIGISVVGGR